MNYKVRFLSLVLVATFTSCTPAISEESNKNAWSQYEITLENQIEWPDILSQDDDHYLVFFYSETCAYCHEIMGDVIAFSKAEIVMTYFLDIQNSETKIPIKNEIDETIGKSDFNDVFIMGTPTIIEVYEHTIKANVAGIDNCLTLLNELRLAHK